MATNTTKLICASVALALGHAATVLAQTSSGSETADAGVIEAVIVTAQKRSQSLQDVPLAVTAFSNEALEKSRIESLEGVAVRTPNFVIGHDGPTTPELTIRGIGSTDREAGSERSVVLFVDEVYIGRTGASTFDLFDLERIEVLRGPQGSLFGRNVVGGAVHLVRAKPQNESTRRAQASFGNYGLLEARAVVNEPLSDSLWARVSMSGGQREGQYYNQVFKRRSNDSENSSFRGQLRYHPSESFDGQLTLEAAVDSVDGMASNISQGAATDAAFAAALAPYGYTPNPNPYVTDNRKFGELDRENYSATGRMEWLGDATTLTFIPAYRYTHYDELRDVSGVGFSGSGPSTRGFESTEIVAETYRAASAELRLSSSQSTPLSWVTGLYFLDEQVDRDQIRERQANTTVSRPIFEQANGTKSYAAFGNIRWESSWGLGVSFGSRYTIDEKDFELDVRDTLTDAQKAAILATYGRPASLSPAAEVFAVERSKRFKRWTPEAGIDWKATDDILLFGKVSSGFKSGGFIGLGATRLDAERAFDPETAVNYELGVKAQLFDGRLQVNTSAFMMEFEDLQLRDRVLLIPGDETSAVVTIQNAAAAEIRGLETEFQLALTRNFRFSGGLAYLDTEITETRPGSTIIMGSALPRSPEFSANVAAEYSRDLSFGVASFRVESTYTGDFYFDINEPPSTYEESRTLLNARLGFKSLDSTWEVALWGKNLTDEVYRSFGRTSLADRIALTQMGERRTYGITLSKSWGD